MRWPPMPRPGRRLSPPQGFLPSLGLLLAGPASARAQGYVLWQFDGTNPGEHFGGAVASPGDVDGDGFADVLVGAPDAPVGALAQAGRVVIFSGASGAALLTVPGATAGERFGASLAAVGDLDADGVPDLLVGAPRASPGGLTLAGRAVVASGASGAVLLPLAGSGAGDWFGAAVAGPGDVDGDGVPDLLVGAPQSGPGMGMFPVGTGYARVISGANGGTVLSLSGSFCWDFFGRAVAGTGDVDGDGTPDLMVGATPSCLQASQTPPGYARVFSGANGGTLLSFSGTFPFTGFGAVVARAGDLDGDGVPDLLVGAPWTPVGLLANVGEARAYSGASGSALHTLDGSVAGELFGWSVVGVSDLDGDGKSDFAVGAPGAAPGGLPDAGRSTLFSGGSGAVLLAVDGTAGGDRAGGCVAGVGDANGDGVPDLAIGADGVDPAGLAEAGRADVISFVGIPPGSVLSGTGCPGSAGLFPSIAAAGGNPVPGNDSFGVSLSRALGGTSAILILGFLPLSLNLATLGLPSCTLLASPDVLFASSTTTAGSALVPVPIPPVPSLVGAVAFLQWYVFDPGPGPLPGAMSPALQLLVL